MNWLLIGGLAVLLGIAGLAVWHAFNDPAFYARAIRAVVMAFVLNIRKKTQVEIDQEREENKTGVKRERTDGTPKRGNWKSG